MILRPIANNIGLVDRPCSRKQHQGDIPLIGGLAIFVAITLLSFTFTPFDARYKIYLISTSFMVLIGALDDYHDLNAILRLIAQFLIGSLMVFGADLYIHDLGILFSKTSIELGLGGQIFTILAVVACINAFNMTDGVDGLVGALSLNTFISLGALALWSGGSFNNGFTSILSGAVVAFMFFNLGKFKNGRYKIFMGDAGSMLMGLTVIWMLTFATNSEQSFLRPITAVWFIAVPLMDMFSVMLRRIKNGCSPLTASRDHLHHIFIKHGFSNKLTTILITSISCFFCLVGIVSEIFEVTESLMTGLFIFVFIIYNAIMSKLNAAKC